MIQQVPGSGPLGRVSRDLDEEYYFVAAENRRMKLSHEVTVLFAAFRQLGIFGYGEATPTREEDLEKLQSRQPRFRDTTTWIRHLAQIEDPVSLNAQAGPDPDRPTSPHAWETAVCWHLDVRLAASELPPSRQRLVRMYADGYGWDERTGKKQLHELTDLGETTIATESVRDMLREASRHIRRRCELNVPAPGAPPRQRREQPAVLKDGGAIQRVDREWQMARLKYGRAAGPRPSSAVAKAEAPNLPVPGLEVVA